MAGAASSRVPALRPVPAALAGALLALLLAGCAGGGEGGDAGGEGDGDGPTGSGVRHGAHDASSHLLAPEWRLGDWWALESPEGGPFTHAVSTDAGDHWLVDTDSPDTAFFDALDDISFLGPVRKSDLAGSQGELRVEFLRFPLQAGANWTTEWDGGPKRIEVLDVQRGQASLRSTREDGTTHAEYAYSDAARYFTRFAFHDANGTPAFTWTLRASGSSYSGDLVRWTLAVLHEVSGPIPQGAAQLFPVAAGFTDVWVQAELVCGAGAVALAAGPVTGPAEDRGYSAAGPCPLMDVSGYAVAAPAAEEQWGFLGSSAPAATQGTFDLTVMGRTLHPFRVGEAP